MDEYLGRVFIKVIPYSAPAPTLNPLRLKFLRSNPADNEITIP